jgi:hypothetical protein
VLSGAVRARPYAAAAAGAALVLFASGRVRADETAASSTDAFWYLRAGYGAVHAREVIGGPAVGIGWRYLPEHIGLDLSAFNFVLTTRGGVFDNVSGSFVKASAVYDVSPDARGSPFVMVGAGWGTAGGTVEGTTYRGSGLDFGVAAGYAGWVSRAVKILLQLDATLPTYRAQGSVLVSDGATLSIRRESLYVPSLALSIGFGFGSRKPAP